MKSFFEPTGRLIMSIGKDLIKDPQAAIVELVKNSYDADASYVKITFKKILEDLIITIEDDGHGMSSDIVTGAWMVPSTDYKLKKQVSPKGRKYQGRKGLGRYAVSILGNKLELMTICNGEKTTASFDWDDFNSETKADSISLCPSIMVAHHYQNILSKVHQIEKEYPEKLQDQWFDVQMHNPLVLFSQLLLH